ncbi:MAG: protein-L-isoaspartate(D-aspartate) O-methyltransferase [Magnetococcus sp. DMHC-6]
MLFKKANPLLWDPPETRLERQRMVQEQLRGRGIGDARVLEVMERLPRERFVLEIYQELAYRDGALPIGQEQTISQPYMVAVMAELLALKGEERVLEVGAGSGYGAAVLAQLAGEVVAVERIDALLKAAVERWDALGLENIRGVLGDGSVGYEGLYDAISVTAAAPEIPPSLVAQLRPVTGRMVIPVGTRGMQNLLLVRKGEEGEILIHTLFACTFVPLLGKEGW